MKFTESWLRTLVDPPALDCFQIARALTMGGLEVESLQQLAPPFDKVVVGHIVGIEKHAQADRLNVLQVEVGAARPLQIVCGAPRVALGMKAPCALVGASLPGGHGISATRVRGIESFGMMCSSNELGLAEYYPGVGLLELDEQAPPGTDVRAWLGLDDRVFTLKLTPNRADCLSILGLARELAALTGSALKPLRSPLTQQPVPACELAPRLVPELVGPEADQACRRYLGRRLLLTRPEATTPPWMRQRLLYSGLRSKSLVVDVTNYVMLECGQPLHAFAASALAGQVRVRWAKTGEEIELLDGQKLQLDSDLLVIADDSGPLALAGIMGGAHSAVTPSSQEIFLEAAWFAPAALAGQARRFNLVSDAAYRFERGVDFKATSRAMDYAVHLLLELAGGRVLDAVAWEGAMPERPPVLVRPERVRRLLGLNISEEKIHALLSQLDPSLKRDEPMQGYLLTPPSYRFDLALEVDYVEEIARFKGYDQIPEQSPLGPMKLLPAPEQQRGELKIKQMLIQRGLQEIITYSFVNGDELRNWMGPAQPAPIALLNPIAATMTQLRTTLSVGLLATLRDNLSRKQDQVRIFESGCCFCKIRAEYLQEPRVAGLLYGTRAPEHWSVAAEPVDFYDLKGIVEELVPNPAALQFFPTSEPGLHPGRSARVELDGMCLGWLGELHPRLVRCYDFPKTPMIFELALEPLLDLILPRFVPGSRQQPIQRDLALVVDEAVTAASVQTALERARSPRITRLTLFDLYRGPGLAPGKKSLAFRIVIQDTEKTLTDSEVDALVQPLIEAASLSVAAQLRTSEST